MNLKKFNAMPKEIQELFIKAMTEAGLHQQSVMRKEEQNYVKKLEDYGKIEIVRDVDKEAFIKRGRGTYGYFAKQFGEERINEIVNVK